MRGPLLVGLALILSTACAGPVAVPATGTGDRSSSTGTDTAESATPAAPRTSSAATAPSPRGQGITVDRFPYRVTWTAFRDVTGEASEPVPPGAKRVGFEVTSVATLLDRPSPAFDLRGRLQVLVRPTAGNRGFCNPDHPADPCRAPYDYTDSTGAALAPGGTDTLVCRVYVDVPETWTAADLKMTLKPLYSTDAFSAVELLPPT